MSVDRVQKLVALATHNPNGHEARSAALLACKAIVAGGLVLLEPHDPRLLLRAWTPQAPAPRPQPAPPPARPAPPQRRPMRDDEEPRRIRARFASRCVVCGDGIEENERVWWRPGRGAWCLCHGEEVGL